MDTIKSAFARVAEFFKAAWKKVVAFIKSEGGV